MLEVFVDLLCSLLMSITGFYILEKIIGTKVKLNNIRNIILIIILSIIVVILHKMKYTNLYVLKVFIVNVIIYKLIFSMEIEKSIISTGILMILVFFGELLCSIVFVQFMSMDTIQTNPWIYLYTNICMVLFLNITIRVKTIQRKLNTGYISIIKNTVITNIIYFLLLVIGVGALIYNIGIDYTLDANFISNVFICIILLALTLIFMKNKDNYNKLTIEYDNLFTYVQNFEDWIEKEQLNRHEYKNQLAVLRCLTKEKKIKDKIDEILEENINLEGEIVHQLKALPKGGIKGLMYYKAVIAQKQNINLTFNVSIERKSILNKLSEKEIRVLCKLIGIYFDNAIEAAKETRKKIILIEVYELKNKVNIVFSNTFKKHKSLKERNKKGISSKGKNRGNGLYFASKLLTKNNWINEKQEIIDEYYIQQLTIHNKNP